MLRMPSGKCWFVLVTALGVGGYFCASELTAWHSRGSSKAEPGVEPARVAVKLDDELEPLVQSALSDEAEKSESAKQKLRGQGPRALQYVIQRAEAKDLARWKSLADAVAAQRDSHFSGLYWHTDLATAREVAAREGKPILSLRLLGKLTDELSCANSRFFRTTLYPHQEVRAMLADRFVLHWESVRPVPIITIDFGDGRSIRRTITGNSLHLVLDARGRTVDVLPGLYGPGFFARVLQESESLARRAVTLNDDEFATELNAFHQQKLADQEARWSTDWKRLGVEQVPQLASEHDDAAWSKLAQQYMAEVSLDGATIAAMRSKAPAEAAGKIAVGKAIVETPALRQVRNFVPVLGQDTVQNEYKLHRQIHQWLAGGGVPKTAELTARIYNELFLSPLDDPWYGLSRPDVYSAVPNDGRHTVSTK